MTTDDILFLVVIGLIVSGLAVVSVAILAAHLFRRTRPTCTEVVLALGIIGLLAAIILANFVKALPLSSRSSCIGNLKRIEGAKATWQIERHKAPTDVPADSDLFGPSAYIRNKPLCPADGTYFLGTLGEKARCSIGSSRHTLP